MRIAPRLMPPARRLATILLATQILVVASGLETFEWACCGELPYWHLTWEQGYSERLSGLQLGLIGGLALLTAWIAKAAPRWQRVYFAGFGSLFLFLGYDELSWLHEQNETLYRLLYTALGAVLVASTLYIARRDRGRGAGWHGALLGGLAIMALGGMVVDQLGYKSLSLILPGLEVYHAMALEEMLELFGAWVVLLAALGLLDAHAPRTANWTRRLLNGLTALAAALLLALLLRNPYLRAYSSEFTRAFGNSVEFVLQAERKSAAYGNGVAMAAFHLRQRDDGISFAPILTAQRSRAFSHLGYSLHLLDQATGVSLASVDTLLNREADWRGLPGVNALAGQDIINETWTELAFPPDMPRNRAYSLALTLWREDEDSYIREEVRSSDLPMLGDTQLIVREFALPAPAQKPPDYPPLANFENGFLLQSADIPQSAAAGETLVIRFRWRSDNADTRDYTQFMHLRHEDSDALWGHDQPPLGDRLPTRLWRKGLDDSETWQAPLPADLPPGRYALYTGLYRASDLQRLPARDAAGAPLRDHILPLGALTLQ